MQTRNAYLGICCGLSLLLLSCSPQTATKLPVVDIIGGLNNVKPLSLSEITERIDYVKLETNPECLIGSGSAIFVDRFIYIKDSRPARLLVFDLDGKFIRQISRQGKGPGEYTNFAYFDVSQDNRYIAIGGIGGGVKLYTTIGEFKAEAQLNAPFLSGFLFQNPDKLVIYEAQLDLPQQGYPAMIARNTENLRADTLMRTDMEQQQSDMVFPMAYSAFYRFGESINFMKPANDTLYQLDKDLRISPRMVLDCGDRGVTKETLFMTSGKSDLRPYPRQETKDYLFIGAGKGDEYGILVYDKGTGEISRMPPQPSRLYENAKAYGPENDLEGIGFDFNNLRTGNLAWTSMLQISDLKAFFEAVNQDQLNLKTRKYFDELRNLAKASDVNDNPVVRIVYLK